MRVFNRSIPITLSSLALAAAVAAACAPDLPTEATPGEAAFAPGGNTSPGYTSVNLGTLAGDNSSLANGVNDAGEVVGYSCCSPGLRAFVTLAGALTSLPGDGSNAVAISNGSPAYIVGWAGAPSQPVRWSIAAGEPSQPTYLDLGDKTFGAARGVNDAGEAVGKAGSTAAMWNADGDLTATFLADGFVRGEGRDINNDGLAVFAFFTSGPVWGGDRGYLRLASGELILLPPLAGDITSYVNSLSEVTENTVHVVGSSYTSQGFSRAVRWLVNATTGEINNTEIRPERSHAVAISNVGDAAGFLEGAPNSLKSTAFLWRGTDLLSLKPPKGAKDGKAWAMSPSGEFVAGEAIVQLSRRAMVWRFPSQ